MGEGAKKETRGKSRSYEPRLGSASELGFKPGFLSIYRLLRRRSKSKERKDPQQDSMNEPEA